MLTNAEQIEVFAVLSSRKRVYMAVSLHSIAKPTGITPTLNRMQYSTCQIRHMAFCNAVTAFKGGKQLADAQPLMQTIIFGPNKNTTIAISQ